MPSKKQAQTPAKGKVASTAAQGSVAKPKVSKARPVMPFLPIHINGYQMTPLKAKAICRDVDEPRKPIGRVVISDEKRAWLDNITKAYGKKYVKKQTKKRAGKR